MVKFNVISPDQMFWVWPNTTIIDPEFVLMFRNMQIGESIELDSPIPKLTDRAFKVRINKAAHIVRRRLSWEASSYGKVKSWIVTVIEKNDD